MRRADRLFQIVQLLRGGRVVTAAALAQELLVSERTIYRDVVDLVRSGVPIEGEAGVGYCMPRGFDLPPLMFSEEEIEALVLGARMVESWGGPTLARQAKSVISKVEHVLPERLRSRLWNVGLYAPGYHVSEELVRNVEPVREALTRERKLRLAYTSAEGSETDRVVRPLGLYYWGTAWTLLAWCELRDDFRSFRPDRMREVAVLQERIPDDPAKSLEAFLERVTGGDRE